MSNARVIVGKHGTVNPKDPGTRDFDGLTIYVLATDKGSLRAVTSWGEVSEYNRTTKCFGPAVRVGDRMTVVLDTMGRGQRTLGGWHGYKVVGIATIDGDVAICEGEVPSRQITRYYCD